MGPLDLARLFVGTALLAFASYTDWRWRRAPNVLWGAMIAAGLVLLAIEAVLDPAGFRARWPYLAGAPVFALAIYGAWRSGLVAGGADAKALMALALLAPFPIAVSDGVPPFASPIPGAFVVLANSLLAVLLVPVAMALRNALAGAFHFPAMFLGVRRPVASLGAGHYWPMEDVVEGERRLVLFPSRRPVEAEALRASFEKLGVREIWMTPKVPYMIPLLLGFVLAFAAGDLLFALLGLVLPAPGAG